MSLHVEKKPNIQQTTTELKPAVSSNVQKNVPMVDADKIELNVDKYRPDSSNTLTNKTENNTSLNKIYKIFERQIAKCGLSIQEAMRQDFLAKITGKTNEELLKISNSECAKLTNEINAKIKIAQRISKSKKITLDNILEARREFDSLNQVFDIDTLQKDIQNGGKKIIGHEGIEGLMERYYTSIKKAGGFDKLNKKEKIKYMNRFFAGHDFKNDKAQLQSFAKLFVNSSLENRRLMVGVIKSLSVNNRETAVDCWLNGFTEGDERKIAVNKSEKDGTLEVDKITMGSYEHFDEIEGHKAFDKYNPAMEKEGAARVTTKLVRLFDKDAAKIHQKQMETLKKDTLEKQNAYKNVLAKIKNGEKPTVEEAKLLKEYYKLKELGYNMDAEYEALTGTASGTIVGYSINEALQEVLEGHDKTIAEELIAESNKNNQALSKQYNLNFDKDVDTSINNLINEIAENHPELLGDLSKEDFLAQVKDTINKATEGSFYENIGETPKTENKTVEPTQNEVSVPKETQATSIGFANQEINVTTKPAELTQKLYNIPTTTTKKEDTKTEVKKSIEECDNVKVALANGCSFIKTFNKFGKEAMDYVFANYDKNDEEYEQAIKLYKRNPLVQNAYAAFGIIHKAFVDVLSPERYLALYDGNTCATEGMTKYAKKQCEKIKEKKS